MNYRSWEDEVPKEIKRDSVWNSKVIKRLLTMIPNQRGGVLKEEPLTYHAEFPAQTLDQSIDAEEHINVVPLP